MSVSLDILAPDTIVAIDNGTDSLNLAPPFGIELTRTITGAITVTLAGAFSFSASSLGGATIANNPGVLPACAPLIVGGAATG